ncbi:hypothetical protein JRQ81_003318 [Phrynocephalus forsythii]|uniref:THD domain-containing protein n=1 Tax=Phrynocephalus forsythii TaxID=171643 RepID=A0A9Q0XKC5_9SAUR|nr:hypothetical protein JRQ81_003318 [Phrynocephalus forsythii]
MELPEVPSGPRPRACSAVRCALGLTLLSLVASLAALTVTLMKGSPPPSSSSSSSSSSLLGPPEKQNYAQLVLKLDNSSISKRELDWHSSETIQGVSLGSSFEYSSKTLKVTVGGLYCIYVQLNITHRLGSREAVNASLVIHRHTATGSGSVPVLTLHLDLSYNSSETVALFKAVTFRLENDDRLHVSIEASQNAHRYGSLNGRNSFFGLFQILDTVPV